MPELENNSSKFYTYGNGDFITRALNNAEDDYSEEPYLWQGLVETNITVTQAVTKFSADYNPNYVSIKGTPTGSGTIKLFGIKNEEWQKLMNVIAFKGKGVRFGSGSKVKYFSASITEKTSDEGKNKIIYYKMNIKDLPSIATKTDMTNARDITLNVELSPLVYKLENGEEDLVIYDLLNSKDDVARWEENKDTIEFPYELTEV